MLAKLLPERHNLYGNSLDFKLNIYKKKMAAIASLISVSFGPLLVGWLVPGSVEISSGACTHVELALLLGSLVELTRRKSMGWRWPCC